MRAVVTFVLQSRNSPEKFCRVGRKLGLGFSAGTQKYVHLDCLRRWQNTLVRREKDGSCAVDGMLLHSRSSEALQT